MTKQSPKTAASRLDRLIHERVHDPYKAHHKPPEPSVCPECNAVFRQGRWQWAEAWPLDSHPVLCQACRRIRDDYPAGTVSLSGGFIAGHRAEILALVQHQEQQEKNQHPLHRIMRIEEGAETMVIQTTDLHLPRRIGEALHRAFKGELNLRYQEEGCFLRTEWRREA